MIQCIIDGNVAYPDMGNKIKVTYENQYIKDSGSYTYQMSFPMSIMANKALFNNVDRFDVKKGLPDIEDCRLLIDNRLIISGKGSVVGITNTAVKLQIIGGKSRIKYNSKFTSHYLDEIKYPDTGIVTSTKEFKVWYKDITLNHIMEIDLSKTPVVGRKGQWVFCPVYDETNDIIANKILVTEKGTEQAYMYDVAIQPYLFYILRYVLAFEGFTIRRNDFDRDPWNRLVICNARKGTDINLALPHWSVYTFIEEIRKLFNASFVFDEFTKTVDIISTNELTSNTAVSYDCFDEFTVDYDEDGLKNLATSNVQYDFAESCNRDVTDVIPLQVLKKFSVKYFVSKAHVLTAARAMTQKERMTTIFKTPEEYFLFISTVNEKGEDVKRLESAGIFNPIIRDEESEDYEDLKICPVAMTQMNIWRDGDNVWLKRLDVQPDNLKIVLPSMSNDNEPDLESMTIDEKEDEYYISVQDALEDTDIITEKEEDNDFKMQVMFTADYVFNYKNQSLEEPERVGAGKSPAHRYPTAFTDYRKYGEYHDINEKASLSLNAIPLKDTIGNYASNIKVDRHNLITIRFVTDEIPDPTHIYVFRNKRYICQKVEIEITNHGVDKVKTGYFYELD